MPDSGQQWWVILQAHVEETQSRLDKLEGVQIEPRLRHTACEALKLTYTPGMSLCARKLSLLRAMDALAEIENRLSRELTK